MVRRLLLPGAAGVVTGVALGLLLPVPVLLVAAAVGAGGLAMWVARRRRPLEGVGADMTRLRLRREAPPQERGLRVRPDHPYWLGRGDVIATGQRVDVALPPHVLRRHMLVVGATRRGKSLGVLLPLLRQQVRRHAPLLLLTFKRDEPLIHTIVGDAITCGRAGDVVYVSLSPQDGEATGAWDPWAWPDPTVVAEALSWAAVPSLATTRYYLSVAHDLAMLLQAIAAHRGERLTFPVAAAWLEGAGPRGPGRQLWALVGDDRRLRARLSGIPWEVASDLLLLVRRLAVLPAMSPAPGRRELRLEDILRGRAIAIVVADAMAAREAAAAVGRMLMAELAAALPALGRREADPLLLVAVDEVAAVAGDQLVGMLARAGGYGVGLVLATQTVADLRAAGERERTPGMWRQVTEGVGSHAILSVASEEEARYWAGMSGEHLVPRAYARDPQGAWPYERQHLVHPNVLLALPAGVGLVYVPRSCLWAGNTQVYSGWEAERREAVLLHLSYPAAAPPLPPLVGGAVAGEGRQEQTVAPTPTREEGDQAGDGGGPLVLGEWE